MIVLTEGAVGVLYSPQLIGSENRKNIRTFLSRQKSEDHSSFSKFSFLKNLSIFSKNSSCEKKKSSHTTTKKRKSNTISEQKRPINKHSIKKKRKFYSKSSSFVALLNSSEFFFPY